MCTVAIRCLGPPRLSVARVAPRVRRFLSFNYVLRTSRMGYPHDGTAIRCRYSCACSSAATRVTRHSTRTVPTASRRSNHIRAAVFDSIPTRMPSPSTIPTPRRSVGLSSTASPARSWDAAADGEHYCLAAPGVHEVDYPYNPGPVTDQGRSYAAPVVSATLAMMKDRFRAQLGNVELVKRLMATADDRLHEDDDPVHDGTASERYGAGVVDPVAALSPVGVSRAERNQTKGRSKTLPPQPLG